MKTYSDAAEMLVMGTVFKIAIHRSNIIEYQNIHQSAYKMLQQGHTSLDISSSNTQACYMLKDGHILGSCVSCSTCRMWAI